MHKSNYFSEKVQIYYLRQFGGVGFTTLHLSEDMVYLFVRTGIFRMPYKGFFHSGKLSHTQKLQMHYFKWKYSSSIPTRQTKHRLKLEICGDEKELESIEHVCLEAFSYLEFRY